MWRWAMGGTFAVGMLVPRAAVAADDPPDWGVQLGGPAVFEVMFRPRIAGAGLVESITTTVACAPS